MYTVTLNRLNPTTNTHERLVICSERPIHESIMRAIYKEGWTSILLEMDSNET